MTNIGDFIGSTDAAELLQISPRRLQRWVSAGKVPPAMKLPGKTGAYLFDRAEVEKLARQAA